MSDLAATNAQTVAYGAQMTFGDQAESIILDSSKNIVDKMAELSNLTDGAPTDDQMLIMQQLFQQYSRMQAWITNMFQLAHEGLMGTIRNMRN